MNKPIKFGIYLYSTIIIISCLINTIQAVQWMWLKKRLYCMETSPSELLCVAEIDKEKKDKVVTHQKWFYIKQKITKKRGELEL